MQANYIKNPYFFVAAASITSHTFKPNLAHINATSLARPFMALKVFYKSFVISAACVEDTL